MYSGGSLCTWLLAPGYPALPMTYRVMGDSLFHEAFNGSTLNSFRHRWQVDHTGASRIFRDLGCAACFSIASRPGKRLRRPILS
jgi:hypothetical protein